MQTESQMGESKEAPRVPVEIVAHNADEALKAMVEHGVALVPRMLSQRQCRKIVNEANKYHWSLKDSGFEELYVKTPRKSQMTRLDSDFRKAKRKLATFFNQATSVPKGMGAWVKRVKTNDGLGGEFISYEGGGDVSKHVDQTGGEWQSQMLLTVQGSAELAIFETLADDEPKYRIPIQAGDLILMRGNEVEDLKQPPHAVIGNQNRIVWNLYPPYRITESEMPGVTNTPDVMTEKVGEAALSGSVAEKTI